MDLQQLKYFKAVATIGKISEAADSLFISAPALSTSIARLEKELGVSLFDRAGNRIVLNTQGEIFLRHVTRILSQLEIAREEVQQSLTEKDPTVSIISMNSFLWIDLVSAFAAEFPDYTMSSSMLSTQRLEQTGFPPRFSFLFAYENEVPAQFTKELNSLFLFNSKPVVMLHKDHPLANEPEIDVRMLQNEKILMSYRGFPLNKRILQLFEMHGLPGPSDNCYSHLARQKMVSDNIGISFASHVADTAFSANIRYVPLVDPFAPWVAKMYWSKDRPLTAQEHDFLTFTENYYRDLH